MTFSAKDRFNFVVLIVIQVHMSAPNVGQFVDVVANLPVDYDALEYLMSEWTKLQGENSWS